MASSFGSKKEGFLTPRSGFGMTMLFSFLANGSASVFFCVGKIKIRGLNKAREKSEQVLVAHPLLAV
jgi:hypothetical protein